MPIFNTTISGGGTTPTGSISITSNGTYDVTSYASANVNVPVDALPNWFIKRTLDANGKIVIDTSQTSISTAPATDVGGDAFSFILCMAYRTRSVDCSSLTTVSGQYAFQNAFYSSQNINTYNFSNLKTISGRNAFLYAFGSIYSGATSVSFPSLTAITGNGAFANAFADNGIISTVTFGNTAAITFGTNPFGGANSDGMFLYCYQNIDVYAPAANQAEIEAMTGYPNFGAEGTVTWHWQS